MPFIARFVIQGSSQAAATGTPYQSTTDIDTQIGTPVYLKPDGHIDAASAADGVTALVRGLTTTEVVQGAIAAYVDDGFIDRTDWTAITGAPSLTTNADYYLGDTPGTLTEIPPETGYLSRVGFAATANRLSIELETPIQL